MCCTPTPTARTPWTAGPATPGSTRYWGLAGLIPGVLLLLRV